MFKTKLFLFFFFHFALKTDASTQFFLDYFFRNRVRNSKKESSLSCEDEAL